MSFTKLTNIYGNKDASSSDASKRSLSAGEWNSLLGVIDSNFENISSETESTSSSVDKTTLLSLLKMSGLTDNLGIDVDESTQVAEEDVTSENTSTLTTTTTYTSTLQARGANALYNLVTLHSYPINTTTATLLANVDSAGNETALGDRVRFGSWYIPTTNLATYNCSHEFIELVNSGTEPFPLNDIKLIIIYSDDLSSVTDSKDFNIKEITLNNSIAAKSSYLIRGLELVSLDLNSTYIKLGNNYDIDIANDIKDTDCLRKASAFVLCAKNYTLQTDNGFNLVVTSDTTWTYFVDLCLVDFVILDKTSAGKLTLHVESGTGANVFGANPSYEKTRTANCIVKDQYSLDPAKQAFRSLSYCTKEASNMRTEKVASEIIPLSNYELSFPHTKNTQLVTKYAPKASGLKKNVLTDKTSPDFDKPNMVTCSFGTNMRTTRCFNWFSMGTTSDEYVWIREEGKLEWHRFESYKSGDGTTSTDANTKMHRVEFKSEIINSVYKRMIGTFPGDSTYTYTAHKCIVYIQSDTRNMDTPITYLYIVGKALNFNGVKIPKEGATSDIQTFTIYPKDWTPKVYHVTDLQGFGWMEYQVWASAAEELNARIKKECTTETKLFPVLINTGDMTQNGTRVNEWLDYYNAGKTLFKYLEQTNVVGNNDLCNSYSYELLGNGDDAGKSSPYYFHLFYCYEIPNDTTSIADTTNGRSVTWTGSLICNGVYIPSMYYMYFNTYGYLLVNSELTLTTCQIYFKQNSTYANLYTGYDVEEVGTSGITYSTFTTNKDNYLGKTLESWIDIMSSLGCSVPKIIVACHEMPFTVAIRTELSLSNAIYDRSTSSNGKTLCGSHLNCISTGNWLYDNTYWFSRMLQDKGIKLCIGGHKHTYAITYPVADIDPKNNDDTSGVVTATGIHFSKLAYINRKSYTPASTVYANLWDPTNTLSNNIVTPVAPTNGIVYCMLLATGYKQTSNKELPSVEQYYSHIVPVTNWTTSKADVSLQYPMYGTYEYNDNSIGINIYRVINILSETVATSDTVANRVCTPSTLSETVFSTGKMYAERLCVVDNDTDGTSTNYWIVPTENIDDCVGYKNGTLYATLRCSESYITNASSIPFIPAFNNYTVEVSLS